MYSATIGQSYRSISHPTIHRAVFPVFATANCTSVEVAGAEGSLSGIYDLDGGSGSYVRYGGVAVYILGKDTSDTWYLGEGAAVADASEDYPYYFVSQST